MSVILPFISQGYHRFLRNLLGCFCAAPWLCHSVLVEFNNRWNISRAVENRGMDPEIGGFNHLYMIDEIQRLTATWYPDQPLYSQWVAPVDSEDSGERAGLADSVLTFDGKPTGATAAGYTSPDLREEGTSSDDINCIDQRVPVPQLLPSARHLASLMNNVLPVTPVSTPPEKQKFKDEYFRYLRVSPSTSSRDHQRVNFAAWTTDWNKDCGRIASGEAGYVAIKRKNVGHLQSYANSFKDSP